MVDYNTYLSDLYRTQLGRDPDAEGLSYWTRQLAGGTPLESVRQSFASSPEAIVRQAYLTQLGREPDREGSLYWQRDLASGMTPEQLRTTFQSSPEFAQVAVNQYGGLLGDIYKNELGRDPDEGGLSYWAKQLRSGAISQADLPRAFSNTPEGFVFDLYESVLGRKPDAGGLKYWMDALETGRMTKEQVANAFKQSEEGQRTLNPPKTDTNTGRPIENTTTPNTQYANQYGKVSVFDQYSPMSGFADPRSQPFGFLYDSINERLGYDAAAQQRGLLDQITMNVNAPRQAPDPYRNTSNYYETVLNSIPQFQNSYLMSQQQPAQASFAPTPQPSGNLSTQGGSNPNLVGNLLNARAMVTTAYQQLLKRAPDQGGLDYWTNDLLSGRINEAGLRQSIMASPEFMKLSAPVPTNSNFDGGGGYGGEGNGN